MPAFSSTELRVIDALAKGTSMKKLAEKSNLNEDTVNGIAEELKGRLGAGAVSEIPDRFRDVTGWSGAPGEYPV